MGMLGFGCMCVSVLECHAWYWTTGRENRERERERQGQSMNILKSNKLSHTHTYIFMHTWNCYELSNIYRKHHIILIYQSYKCRKQWNMRIEIITIIIMRLIIITSQMSCRYICFFEEGANAINVRYFEHMELQRAYVARSIPYLFQWYWKYNVYIVKQCTINVIISLKLLYWRVETIKSILVFIWIDLWNSHISACKMKEYICVYLLLYNIYVSILSDWLVNTMLIIVIIWWRYASFNNVNMLVCNSSFSMKKHNLIANWGRYLGQSNNNHNWPQHETE